MGPANSKKITVVGAGLAGSEAAWQLAEFGYDVELIEMRPVKSNPAHKTPYFAELVCSNSFGSASAESATGQLKWEAAKYKSLIYSSALQAQVPAGQALGVDREIFSTTITRLLHEHPKIKISHRVIESLDQISRPAIIATGPLTDNALAMDIIKKVGKDYLYFFDAIAPIISADSIDFSQVWRADRYGKCSADYLNCPLDKNQYIQLIEAIQSSQKVIPKDFENTQFFEGCMPIEEMVRRGPETPRFGPMKPVGLDDPKTGRWPYAVVQLRQENLDATAYNMVGFQTRMTYGEQLRVFRMIPGLEDAEFLKLGSMHRNLFLNSPSVLSKDLSLPADPMLFFAGQMTGVEGYFESAMTGLLVAHFLNQKLNNLAFSPPPRASALGSVLNAITSPERAEHFQPTNINFGLFPPLKNTSRDKKMNRLQQINLAKEVCADFRF
jgi:methylenetetrahydrofolate--tRNA-(uracil-5-)-methyltransferase